MAINFMEFLKESFEGIDSLNLDQLRKVLVETNAYFASLESIMRYGDAEAKEAALKEALELKEFLDFKATRVSKFKGLDALNEEEREMVNEMNLGTHLVDKGKNKAKVKKLKPIKLS